MNKKRIKILEEIKKNKDRPNNGNVKINYENQMTKEEKEEYMKQGIKIIDVVYV